MTQILAHLIGDYILQTNKMATCKTASWLWAFIHAATYTLPFLFLTRSIPALLVIALTHAVIDRYRLARWVILVKNAISEPNNLDAFITPTGYPAQVPEYMAFWLLIIADNTIHLCINYAALRWL
jgi:hypothetical protein